MDLLTILITLTAVIATAFVLVVGYTLDLIWEPEEPEPTPETAFDEGLIRWSNMLDQTRKDA